MSERSIASAAVIGRNDDRCEWRPRPKRPHCRCIGTDQPPKRPDPAIYSQPQRLSSGQSASWESPDIQTNWWDDWRFMDSNRSMVFTVYFDPDYRVLRTGTLVDPDTQEGSNSR